MFSGLLWRKPQTSPSISQEGPSTADGASPSPIPQQLRTPSPSELALDPTNAPATKTSPSRSLAHENVGSNEPVEVNPLLASINPETDPEGAVKALLELLPSIPAKTLHSYTTTHLNHISTALSNPSDDSPIPASKVPSNQIPALLAFFATLTPPPQLHCVRCHKEYTEVENNDRSCLVAHDDESAEVERVGRSRVVGEIGTEYETIWNCCGKTVEGDGDQGPPDGWCYEGKHTTDIKRARFRADSTPLDDKLVSCLRRNCHNVRSQLPRSRSSRTAAVNNKKRPRYAEEDDESDEDGDEGDEDSGVDEIVGGVKSLAAAAKGSSLGAGAKGKGKGPAKKKGGENSVEGSVKKRAKITKDANKPLSGSTTKAKADEDVEMGGVDDQPSAAPQTPAKPPPKPRGRPKKKPAVETAQTDVDEPVPPTDAETPQAKPKKPRAKPGPKPKSKAAANDGTDTPGSSTPKTTPKSAKPRSKKAVKQAENEDDGNVADESMAVDGEDGADSGPGSAKKNKEDPKIVVQMRAKAKVKKAQSGGA